MNRLPMQTILNEKAADGIGTPIFVGGYNNILVQIGSTNSGACKLKFMGTVTAAGGSHAPDFSATRTPANHWDYIGIIDLQDGTAIAGDTGITFAGTDVNNVRTILINTDALDWLDIEVSSYTAGKITAKASAYSI